MDLRSSEKGEPVPRISYFYSPVAAEWQKKGRFLEKVREYELPGREGLTVEFKPAWSGTVKKTLIAFANTLGGRIFFGVDDEGRAVGLRDSPQNEDAICRSVITACRDEIEPPMSSLVTFARLNVGGRRILEVTVEPGRERPYGLKGARLRGGVYLRDGSASVVATEDELFELIRKSVKTPWEERMCAETGLTFQEAARVFTKYGVTFTESHHTTLGLKTVEVFFTNLGLLLSDQSPRTVKVGRFLQARSGPAEFQTLSGSLLTIVEEAVALFDEINPRFVRKTDALASEVRRAWPPSALREALVNCVVHRYYDLDMETAVNIEPGAVEIVSFGAMPDQLTRGAGKCRNRALADIFVRLGWMEKDGTGFPDTMEAYAENPDQPQITAGLRHFSIRLPRLSGPAFTVAERIEALFAFRHEWKAIDIEAEMRLSRSAVTKALSELAAGGKILKIGGGRSTRYCKRQDNLRPAHSVSEPIS